MWSCIVLSRDGSQVELRYSSLMSSSDLPGGGVQTGEDFSGLDAVLDEARRRVRARFPSLEGDLAGLAEFLTSKLPENTSPRALLDLKVEDLSLAFACAKAHPEAIRCFDEEYLGGVAGMLGHMRLTAAQVDEVRQCLRVDLIVARENGSARIMDFNGTGDLRGWLRVAAVRVALKLLRARANDTPLEEGDRLLDACVAEDPELKYLKRDQQLAFREALADAMRSLDVRGSNLLRLHYLEGLSLEELAKLEHVHRATVARWLEKARGEMLERTRQALTAKLRLSESECASFMRLAQSRFDLSLRVLGEPYRD